MVGDRLPSEAQLTKEHQVSRTVVREAIASLRADGLVEPRKGAGVFVVERKSATPGSFENVSPDRVSSMIEIQELRIAIEVECAGLAAQRRSPSQQEALMQVLTEQREHKERGVWDLRTDFALHLAIADAANNPRFREFLENIETLAIPKEIFSGTVPGVDDSDVEQVLREHEAIVQVIVSGDAEVARTLMRSHLQNGQKRYRDMLWQAQQKAGAA